MLDASRINQSTKVVSLPCAIREHADGVVLRRGKVSVEVTGAGAADTVAAIVSLTASAPIAIRDLLESFAETERPAIKEFVLALLNRRLLVPAEDVEGSVDEETPAGIFYWHFNQTEAAANRTLSAFRIDILGFNQMTLRLMGALKSINVMPRTVIDHPLLRDPTLFNAHGLPVEPPEGVTFRCYDDGPLIGEDAPDMVIGTAIGSGWSALRLLNAECVARGVTLMPVTLQGLVGRVGPIVVPGDTACLECTRARENSNLDDAEATRKSEFETDLAAEGEGYLTPMANILGDVAAMELARFVLRIPKLRVGALIDVNLLTARMDPRPVLKVPRCRVCSPVNNRALTAMKENLFLLD